jgi:murein L,D-transpeptidase YafK
MRRIIFIFLIVIMLGMTIYNNYPPRPSLPDNITIDSLVVIKSKRQLLAFSKKQLIKTYHIALGGNPVGDKKYEGDKRTPEGLYFINDKNENSSFHKNLGVSYPNARDIREAASMGKPPGGDIKIHGLKNGLGIIGKLHRLTDWTNGCMALTNPEMDELFVHTPVGTPVKIEK